MIGLNYFTYSLGFYIDISFLLTSVFLYFRPNFILGPIAGFYYSLTSIAGVGDI
jgi:hypothetical protein